MKKRNKLSVIIPVYNEENTLKLLLEKVIGVELIENMEKEIVVVNDGSEDNSQNIVQQIINEYPLVSIKYAEHMQKSGKGKAIRTGLELVTGDYVIIQDADLEYEPNEYNLLLEYLLTHNGKVVYGSRFLNKANTYSYLMFYWGGRVVSLCANILYNQRLTDEPTCYKMFDTNLLKSVGLECDGFDFCPEVTAKVSKLGYKIPELPISYLPRKVSEGKKIKWHDGLRAIWVLIKYRLTR